MADFFDDLGKRITEVVSDVSKAAGDTVEIQKIKSQMRSLKREDARDYESIGKMVYEKFKDHEIVDLEMVTFCESIEKREEELEKCKAQIDRIKEDI